MSCASCRAWLSVVLVLAGALGASPGFAVLPAAVQVGGNDCPTPPSSSGECPSPGSDGNEPAIVGQENLWFSDPRHGGINYMLDGEVILPFKPRLGLTSSSSASAKMQEMQWFFRYTGQTSRNAVFSVEWIAPRDLVDRNLRKTFLPLIEQTEARWNIFYDPVLASVWRGLGPGPVDFSRPAIRQMFQDDLVYLRELYFDHPNYWRIGGKPVLHVWGARVLVKNADELFQSARDSGIYICGDVFGQTGPEPPLDCRTGFSAATQEVVSRDRFQTVQQVLPDFERYFQSSLDGGVDTIPAFSFQYDDVDFRTRLGTGGTSIQILAQGREDIRDRLDLADRYAYPIDGTRYIWVGTLNGWAEGTTVYPTEASDREFWSPDLPRRIAPYGYAKLEELQKRLFPDNPYRGPRIERRPDDAVLFRDCDILAGVSIKVTKDGVTRPVKFEPLEGVTLLPNFDREWRPEFSYDKITIRVKNLDGKRTRKVVRR